MTECDTVLLLGHGGPTAPGEVAGYLSRVLGAAASRPEAMAAATAQYGAIGGRSPYNAGVAAQRFALQRALAARGVETPVTVGLLYAQPSVDEALLAAAERGGAVLAVALAPFQSPSSWGRYEQAVQAAADRLGAGAPAVRFLEPFCDDPRFAAAVAERVGEARRALGARNSPERTRLIFTTHAIPRAEAERSPYAAQFARAAEAAATRAGWGGWALAYQSCPASAGTAARWTGPEVGAVLRLAARGEFAAAIIVPIGFLCENKETLFDLDILAARDALGVDLPCARAQTVGDHPLFVEMLADRISRMLQAECARPLSPSSAGPTSVSQRC